MSTICSVSITSDIAPGLGTISKSMTLTKAGTVTDLEETTGFSRRKLAATTAVDIIDMSKELVEPSDNTAAKVYIRNIGDGKGNIDKSTYVTISIGDTGGTPQEIGRLCGGDWLLMPLTVVDDKDVVAAPENNNTVVLEYIMFFE